MISMGDLIGFNGFLNTSTPFSLYEHTATWRGDRQYLDFKWSNDYNNSCTYPRFWGENGLPVVLKMTGCYNRFLRYISLLILVNSISTVILKLSVSSPIGNVNYPSSPPCKIVFENGNPVSATKSNICLVSQFQCSMSTVSVSIKQLK